MFSMLQLYSWMHMGDAEMPSISVGFKNYKLRGVLGYEF